MNQSRMFVAGNPGNFVNPENWPENVIVRKIGITRDGTNVEGTRGINIKLRPAMARATLNDETALVCALMVVRLHTSGESAQCHDDADRQDRGGDPQ